MNIYAQLGDKVVYLDEGGYDGQREYAREKGFVKGQIYEVEFVDRGNSSSSVAFVGMDGWHNSVMFDDHVDAEVEESVIAYQVDEKYNLLSDSSDEVVLSKSIDGTTLIIETADNRIYLGVDMVKEILGLEARPVIDVIKEKVDQGLPVFYQIDVPAYKQLENVWYSRKHSVEITPKNWNDYKNGDVNKFLY